MVVCLKCVRMAVLQWQLLSIIGRAKASPPSRATGTHIIHVSQGTVVPCI